MMNFIRSQSAKAGYIFRYDETQLQDSNFSFKLGKLHQMDILLTEGQQMTGSTNRKTLKGCKMDIGFGKGDMRHYVSEAGGAAESGRWGECYVWHAAEAPEGCRCSPFASVYHYSHLHRKLAALKRRPSRPPRPSAPLETLVFIILQLHTGSFT